MESIRTFIAVNVSPSVQAAAQRLIERLQESEAIVRWQEQANIHITLKFVGDVPNVETPKLCRAVQKIAADHAPFSLRFRGAGAFPNARKPRTVWLGIDEMEGADSLRQLQSQVNEAMEELGYPPEPRRYHPHMTLGRVKSSAHISELAERIEKYDNFDGGSSIVDEMVVYASYLDKSGPTYQPMSRVKLSGR